MSHTACCIAAGALLLLPGWEGANFPWQATWNALALQHAVPASLASDDSTAERRSAAILEMVGRHFTALQPLWSLALSGTPSLDKLLQHEVRSRMPGEPA